GQGKIVGIERRPTDFRCNDATKNGSSSARNPLRKICARIHSRNEKRPKELREVAPRCGEASDRESGPQASRSHELENKTPSIRRHNGNGLILPRSSRKD